MPWGPPGSPAHRRSDHAQSVRPSVRLSSLSLLSFVLLLLLLLFVCPSVHGSASRASISGTSELMSRKGRFGGPVTGALRRGPATRTGPPSLIPLHTTTRCPSWRPSSLSSTSQRHHGLPTLRFLTFSVHRCQQSGRLFIYSGASLRSLDWGRSTASLVADESGRGPLRSTPGRGKSSATEQSKSGVADVVACGAGNGASEVSCGFKFLVSFA